MAIPVPSVPRAFDATSVGDSRRIEDWSRRARADLTRLALALRAAEAKADRAEREGVEAEPAPPEALLAVVDATLTTAARKGQDAVEAARREADTVVEVAGRLAADMVRAAGADPDRLVALRRRPTQVTGRSRVPPSALELWREVLDGHARRAPVAPTAPPAPSVTEPTAEGPAPADPIRRPTPVAPTAAGPPRAGSNVDGPRSGSPAEGLVDGPSSGLHDGAASPDPVAPSVPVPPRHPAGGLGGALAAPDADGGDAVVPTVGEAISGSAGEARAKGYRDSAQVYEMFWARVPDDHPVRARLRLKPARGQR
jgi:hypothetical protein